MVSAAPSSYSSWSNDDQDIGSRVSWEAESATRAASFTTAPYGPASPLVPLRPSSISEQETPWESDIPSRTRSSVTNTHPSSPLKPNTPLSPLRRSMTVSESDVPSDPAQGYPRLTSPLKAFPSSPLNPSFATSPSPSSRSSTPSPLLGPRYIRTAASTTQLLGRVPSEESRVLSTSRNSRGSMILYHIPVPGDESHKLEPPPSLRHLMSSESSRDSMMSISSDSKYPSMLSEHGLVPYAFDPSEDEGGFDKEDAELDARRLVNMVALVAILLGILGLFVIYPVTGHLRNDGISQKIVENEWINGTGQAILGSPA
ncbi:uncharacterized protein EV420DRAFT_751345 [Desarmillaria tabescens]|uniref:Uncharacterized protein n=1 Tax=Armillaria tabescens TaxID=1929756 RepID=A0AA39JWS5_ARMTA|nr:uncharacterized protein EV420DRAFT_751345 [Desarmillaria tabescens]KAK0450367.1 hypothetical protein EV420DRAFT_751345 [Desarmillaria tabescens]